MKGKGKASAAQGGRIWTLPFIVVFTVNIFNALGFHILTPILPKYAVALSLGNVVAGTLGTMFAITSILSRIALLRISLAGRYRKAAMLALGLIGISMAGFSVSTTAPMLYLFRLIQGVGWGICSAVLATLAALTLPSDRIGAGIGMFGLGSVFGKALAPNLGLTLVDVVGYHYTFLIALCMPVISIALCFLLKDLEQDSGAEAKRPAGRPIPLKEIDLRPLFPTLFIFLSMIPDSSISSFIALSAQERGVEGIGLFFTVNAFALLFVRPFFGRTSDKVAPWKILIPALLVFGGVLVALSCARSLIAYLLIAVLYTFSYGSINPTTQAWTTRSVEKAQIGIAQVIFYTGLDLGSGIGSFLAGSIAERTGYAQVYLWMLIPVAVEVIILAAYGLSRPRVK